MPALHQGATMHTLQITALTSTSTSLPNSSSLKSCSEKVLSLSCKEARQYASRLWPSFSKTVQNKAGLVCVRQGNTYCRSMKVKMTSKSVHRGSWKENVLLDLPGECVQTHLEARGVLGAGILSKVHDSCCNWDTSSFWVEGHLVLVCGLRTLQLKQLKVRWGLRFNYVYFLFEECKGLRLAP